MSLRNHVIAVAAIVGVIGAAPMALAQRIPDLNAPRRAGNTL